VAVKIRLKRLGKIRSPHYRIVVMDSRTKRDGRAIEEIGIYHPKNDPSVIRVDSERAQHWLGVGAQPTEAVVALFKRTGDWQQFTGDHSIPSGVDPQPSKPDKLARYNAAVLEAEAAGEAISRPKRTPKKSVAADEPSSTAAAQPAVAEGEPVAEAPASPPAADQTENEA
jgi:small subunit ribosomal protein S16